MDETVITLTSVEGHRGETVWIAEARKRNKLVDFDASASNPMAALMRLAEVLYREWDTASETVQASR